MRKKLLVGVLGGFIIALLWVVGLRFALYSAENTHYHANFALFVNGERDAFDNFTFYEEVQSCNSENVNNPKIRVHLHDMTPDIIHVHDDGVTWAHFFANLGYGLTNNALETDAGVFVDGEDGNSLTFIINGEPVSAIANRPIGDRDVLLVSYGDEDDAVLQDRFAQVPETAEKFNSKPDPSSCSGSDAASLSERFRHAIFLTK